MLKVNRVKFCRDSFDLESELRGDRNTCALRALGALAEIDYGTARAVLASHGRRVGHGTYTEQTEKAMDDLGLVYQKHYCFKYSNKGPRSTHPTINQLLKERPELSKGHYLLYTRNHCFAMIDGKIEDWLQKGRRHRILGFYEVLRCY